jgi:tRNA(Ile)-lysidine synthase
MASSKKLPKSSQLLPQLHAYLVDVFKQHQCLRPKLVVGLSGGLDSCVLLHLLHACQKNLPFTLHAHHVHHGLSPHADAWLAFCGDFCEQLKIPLKITRVNLSFIQGMGIEATARTARYDALFKTDADFVCVAHHQDDQAETLLLQLARGAGVKGMSSMARINQKLLRPLLDVPRSAIEDYAKQQGLAWVEDESNADTRFDRNFMRHEILPKLETQYPAIQKTLSRVAENMAEASLLLDELAQIDMPADTNQARLDLDILAQLSLPRAKNVFRWWLARNQVLMPSESQLTQMMQQLLHAKADAAIQIQLDGYTIRRFNRAAYLVEPFEQLPILNRPWQQEVEIGLTANTRLVFQQLKGQGIACRHLTHSVLWIKNRAGGERLRPDENRPSRSVQRLMQAQQIPPWVREQLPMILLDDKLVMIPNVAIEASIKAAPDEMGLSITWHTSGAATAES